LMRGIKVKGEIELARGSTRQAVEAEPNGPWKCLNSEFGGSLCRCLEGDECVAGSLEAGARGSHGRACLSHFERFEGRTKHTKMPFTPVHTLVGGALLHLSTSSLLEDTGRVLGISGLTESALFGASSSSSSTWQRAVIGGLLIGPVISKGLDLDGTFPADPMDGWRGISIARASLAGLLVGFGSRVSSVSHLWGSDIVRRHSGADSF
jgi:hypothetical protein